MIIDTAGETRLRELRGALVDRGRLVIVGAEHSHRITGGLGRWLRAILWSTVVSQQLRPFAGRPLSQDDLVSLVGFMDRGQRRPAVDRTFPLAEAADAMRYLDHRAGPGKVVVVT